MATDASKKRKRGRPPTASYLAIDAPSDQHSPEQTNGQTDDVDEIARPRKRGRSAKSAVEGGRDMAPQKQQKEQKQQRRGVEASKALDGAERIQKRARPAQQIEAVEDVDSDPSDDLETTQSTAPPPRKGKQARVTATTDNRANGTTQGETATAPAKKRGRPPRADATSSKGTKTAAGAQSKRGRAADVNGGGSKAQSKSKDTFQNEAQSTSQGKSKSKALGNNVVELEGSDAASAEQQLDGDDTTDGSADGPPAPAKTRKPRKKDVASRQSARRAGLDESRQNHQGRVHASETDISPADIEEPPSQNRPPVQPKASTRPRPNAALHNQESQPNAPQHKGRGRQPGTTAKKTVSKTTLTNSSESTLESSAVQTGPKKRGRKPKEPKPSSTGTNGTEPTPQTESSRRSLQEVVNLPNTRSQQVGTTTDAAPPKKRGRKPAHQDVSEHGDENENSSSAPPKPTKKRQLNDPPQPPVGETEAEEQAQEISEISPDRPYWYLEERVRYIPCTVVNNEWDPLKPSSIACIQEMLAAAERTVFESVKDTHDRREHVGSALAAMSRRLIRQVSQVPFPPAVAIPPPLKGRRRVRGANDATTEDGQDDGHDAGRGDELRFETVLDTASDLERRLNPLKHSIHLLEAEKKNLTADIERQRKTLEQLTVETKRDAAFWRDRLRNAHRLAPVPRDVPEGDDDGVDEPKRVPEYHADQAVGTLYQNIQADDTIRDMADQLASHVESMRANAAQIDGVLPAIARSSAALRLVLLKNLDQEQYERVLFGN